MRTMRNSLDVIVRQMSQETIPHVKPAVDALLTAVPDSKFFPEILAALVASMPEDSLVKFMTTLDKMANAIERAEAANDAN